MEHQHDEYCRCRRCTAQVWGEWFDKLGGKTGTGGWDCFVTISYKTNPCPWKKGFPVQHWKPSPDFTNNSFKFFIRHFEERLGERLDFAVADQYGKLNGRVHQHALLAGHGLDRPIIRSEMQSWLCGKAGYSRVLPFQKGAAFYISRYIGRCAGESEWDIRVGQQTMQEVRNPERWGEEIVVSAELPKSAFHQGFTGRLR
jgi:hypothetical protein